MNAAETGNSAAINPDWAYNIEQYDPYYSKLDIEGQYAGSYFNRYNNTYHVRYEGLTVAKREAFIDYMYRQGYQITLREDNIFHGSGFSTMLKNAVHTAENDAKATVFGYWVGDPERYGVAEFDRDGNCLSIEEKPAEPKSNYAVVGLYFYPNRVVDVAAHIKPSARGELEITTVNQEFLAKGQLKVQTLGRGFAWLDTGTHDSLQDAASYVRTIQERQGLKIACIEEIAWRMGFIDREQMLRAAQKVAKSTYGEYIFELAKREER